MDTYSIYPGKVTYITSFKNVCFIRNERCYSSHPWIFSSKFIRVNNNITQQKTSKQGNTNITFDYPRYFIDVHALNYYYLINSFDSLSTVYFLYKNITLLLHYCFFAGCFECRIVHSSIWYNSYRTFLHFSWRWLLAHRG